MECSTIRSFSCFHLPPGRGANREPMWQREQRPGIFVLLDLLHESCFRGGPRESACSVYNLARFPAGWRAEPRAGRPPGGQSRMSESNPVELAEGLPLAPG